jgi:glycosyltransferase involved in cell wall biosynthesis
VGEVPVEGGTFVVVTNGYADGPAQQLRQHLLDRGAARVVEVTHPLLPDGPTEHRVDDHRAGGTVHHRGRDLRLRPPASFALDPLFPARLPRCDGWFGFNCLATGRGLAERALGRAGKVVHWSVDFVPERFGRGPLTKLYEGIDEYCCRHADARVDLSQAALDARAASYGLGAGRSAPGYVVPMGTWLDRTPQVDEDASERRHVVFLGHLVPRMGILTLFDAVEQLRSSGLPVTLEVVGGGELLDEVRARAEALGPGVATVHGFVEHHRDVETILARGTVAAAPYAVDEQSFTRWADPGKLKAYLGAGLPIVMTSTPPNAAELADAGAALVVEPDAASLAAGLREVLDDPARWRKMHDAAAETARGYDWPVVLDRALTRFGFAV